MNNNDVNNQNKNLSNKGGDDHIITMKPQAIKMDILLFKNDVLREIKQIEKSIVEKSKEANKMLKDKISLFDNKMGFINEQITSISNKMVNGIKMEEKISVLNSAREQLLDETTTNKIKINMLEKEARDSINRIDNILKQSIIYPSVIGINGKFRNFHDFIDFVVTESNTNNTFRQKNIMDLSSYKQKIEKSLQALGFRIESILSSCNNFTLRKIKEIQEKFDESLGRYKDKLNELRIENSNYVIQLENDTKDLRNETNIIKSMKNDIFSKVDNDVNNMKKENTNIINIFQTYKNDFEKMNQNIKRLENNIENMLVQRIILLFDEQKKINENIDNIKKESIEYLNDKLNDKIKDIVNEKVKNILKDINIKQINLNNNFNNDDYNNTNNSQINNIIKDKNNINKKSNFFSNKYNNMVNNNNNTLNNINNANNNNKMNIYGSPRRGMNNENENEINYNLNNYQGKTINNNNNNNFMNKKIIENINNKYTNSNINNNNINDNILSELKNDNIITVKKNNFYKVQPRKKSSFHSDSNFEDKKNNNNYNENININIHRNYNNIINNKVNNNKSIEQITNKYSIVSRNKKKHKIKYKFKSEKDKGKEEDNNNDYIKIFNINKNKIAKRRSFDGEKKEDLQKFQKLLKININDIDAKLNNIDNISSSFEILNENHEIFDRFMDSNTITKDNLQNNNNFHNYNRNAKINNKNINNEFNKINILSSPLKTINKNYSEKNLNIEDLSTKNIAAEKTSSDFYPNDPNKKTKNDLKPIKNKKLFQKNNENSSNLIKKTNSDFFNLQGNLKNKNQNIINQNTKASFMGNIGDQMNKQSEDSIHKYHNYFIGFQFGGLEDNKKIKRQKRKNKSGKYH